MSEYLGHADAGFAVRTYTHLMPSSGERTRRAVDDTRLRFVPRAALQTESADAALPDAPSVEATLPDPPPEMPSMDDVAMSLLYFVAQARASNPRCRPGA